MQNIEPIVRVAISGIWALAPTNAQLLKYSSVAVALYGSRLAMQMWINSFWPRFTPQWWERTVDTPLRDARNAIAVAHQTLYEDELRLLGFWYGPIALPGLITLHAVIGLSYGVLSSIAAVRWWFRSEAFERVLEYQSIWDEPLDVACQPPYVFGHAEHPVVLEPIPIPGTGDYVVEPIAPTLQVQLQAGPGLDFEIPENARVLAPQRKVLPNYVPGRTFRRLWAYIRGEMRGCPSYSEANKKIVAGKAERYLATIVGLRSTDHARLMGRIMVAAFIPIEEDVEAARIFATSEMRQYMSSVVAPK